MKSSEPSAGLQLGNTIWNRHVGSAGLTDAHGTADAVRRSFNFRQNRLPLADRIYNRWRTSERHGSADLWFGSRLQRSRAPYHQNGPRAAQPAVAPIRGKSSVRTLDTGQQQAPSRIQPGSESSAARLRSPKHDSQPAALFPAPTREAGKIGKPYTLDKGLRLSSLAQTSAKKLQKSSQAQAPVDPTPASDGGSGNRPVGRTRQRPMPPLETDPDGSYAETESVSADRQNSGAAPNPGLSVNSIAKKEQPGISTSVPVPGPSIGLDRKKKTGGQKNLPQSASVRKKTKADDSSGVKSPLSDNLPGDFLSRSQATAIQTDHTVTKIWPPVASRPFHRISSPKRIAKPILSRSTHDIPVSEALDGTGDFFDINSPPSSKPSGSPVLQTYSESTIENTAIKSGASKQNSAVFAPDAKPDIRPGDGSVADAGQPFPGTAPGSHVAGDLTRSRNNSILQHSVIDPTPSRGQLTQGSSGGAVVDLAHAVQMRYQTASASQDSAAVLTSSRSQLLPGSAGNAALDLGKNVQRRYQTAAVDPAPPPGEQTGSPIRPPAYSASARSSGRGRPVANGSSPAPPADLMLKKSYAVNPQPVFHGSSQPGGQASWSTFLSESSAGQGSGMPLRMQRTAAPARSMRPPSVRIPESAEPDSSVEETPVQEPSQRSEDMDELIEKVYRHVMRKLTIELERRGI